MVPEYRVNMTDPYTHLQPILCDYNPHHPDVTVSKDIEYVTCPKCIYYYFKPEAKVLNDAYKAGRLY